MSRSGNGIAPARAAKPCSMWTACWTIWICFFFFLLSCSSWCNSILWSRWYNSNDINEWMFEVLHAAAEPNYSTAGSGSVAVARGKIKINTQVWIELSWNESNRAAYIHYTLKVKHARACNGIHNRQFSFCESALLFPSILLSFPSISHKPVMYHFIAVLRRLRRHNTIIAIRLLHFWFHRFISHHTANERTSLQVLQSAYDSIRKKKIAKPKR